jgi:MraZ protein
LVVGQSVIEYLCSGIKWGIDRSPLALVMLVGQYIHTLDAKKRISLPVKFRRECGRQVVVTRGLDNCLFLFPVHEWSRISEKLGELSIGQSDTRGFNRFLLSGAVEVDVDSAGRILIPDFLKDFAGLSDKVVLAGIYNRVEIWNESAWSKYNKKIETNADALAQGLGDLGVL